VNFVDEAIISVQSGDGGRGCLSFRREKFIERGGPDGGDGGKGGDVVFETTSQKRTLYQFRHKKQFKAQKGAYGQGKQRHGKNGKDLIIQIPPGTVLFDLDTGEILKDFVKSGEAFTIAKGGRGGQGNKRFASSTNRAPRFAQPGEPGEIKNLKLELKLLADVGIIGFPNAGKSTLISVISAARPKIGSYPFTTLTPNLGVVRTDWGESFVVADIPGLIEGAHGGAGLGINFLKHIERTSVLVHLIDISSIDHNDPLYSYEAINRELALYSEKLANKPQIVVLNKLDLSGAEKTADVFQAALKGKKALLISAATQKGIKRLISSMIESLKQVEKPDS
jgi:GTP-binding protein